MRVHNNIIIDDATAAEGGTAFQQLDLGDRAIEKHAELCGKQLIFPPPSSGVAIKKKGKRETCEMGRRTAGGFWGTSNYNNSLLKQCAVVCTRYWYT